MRDIGSCALLKVNNKFFVATAGHVLDIAQQEKTDHIILAGASVFLIIARNGIRRVDDFKVDNIKVTLDAAVFEVIGQIPEALTESAFSEDMLSHPTSTEWHVIAGYPYAFAKRSSGELSINPTIASFPLHGPIHAIGEPIKYDIDGVPIINISYGFVDYGMTIKNGRLNKMTSLKGMSGGPIIRMTGIPDDPDLPITDPTTMN
jgi:hypothetical protein